MAFLAPLFAPFTLMLALISGCDADEPKEEARAPLEFGIARVTTTTDSDRVEESNQELQLDCDHRLLVYVTPAVASGKLGEFVLAPPDGCGKKASCGWLALFVEHEGSSPLEVMSAQVPLLVELPESMREGSLSLRLELRDADGAPVLTEDDEIASASLDLRVAPAADCSALPGASD